MKYEYLCGYESDFFTMPANVIAVVQLDHCVHGLTEFSQITECGKPVIAMRRIIPEPKRWTIEDQKAGKLPEVGCLVASSTGKISEIVAIKNGYFVMFECGKSNGPLTIHGDLLMKQFKPIESPEEKVARLRSEWCSNALDSASILSGMREYDLKRLGRCIGNIYDAMLSGDLPVPVKEDE